MRWTSLFSVLMLSVLGVPSAVLSASEESVWMDSLRTAVALDSMHVWSARRKAWSAEAIAKPEAFRPYDVLIWPESSEWPNAPLEDHPDFVWHLVRHAALDDLKPIDAGAMILPNEVQEQTGVGWALLFALVAVAVAGWAWARDRKYTHQAEEAPLEGERLDGIQHDELAAIHAVLALADRSQDQIKQSIIHLERLRILFDRVQGQARAQSDWARRLSRNELEVARLLVRRLKSSEIAEILDISPGYVYNIRGAIRKKLDLSDEDDLELRLRQHLKS